MHSVHLYCCYVVVLYHYQVLFRFFFFFLLLNVPIYEAGGIHCCVE